MTDQQIADGLSEAQGRVMGWITLPNFSSRYCPNDRRFVLANGNSTAHEWFSEDDLPPLELIEVCPDTDPRWASQGYASIHPTPLGRRVAEILRKEWWDDEARRK
jgi:hypothetical protein